MDADRQFEEGIQWLAQRKEPSSGHRAAELFRSAADAGHAAACTWLARCHAFGEGVEQSRAEAIRWGRHAMDDLGLRERAQGGDSRAQYALATLYQTGRGVAVDHAESVHWFSLAADQGDVHAQACLGEAYRDGDGVAADQQVAVSWFRKSAEQGDVDAQVCLAEAYRSGAGVPLNHHEAVSWFMMAAAEGDVSAYYWLGCAFRRGDGVDKDERKAVGWFRKAAAQDDAYAQRVLATWDTKLSDIATRVLGSCAEVIFDPDPRGSVPSGDGPKVRDDWLVGEGECAHSGAPISEMGVSVQQRMSPWVVRLPLSFALMREKCVTVAELRAAVAEHCCKRGHRFTVATAGGASDGHNMLNPHDSANGVMRVRLLAAVPACGGASAGTILGNHATTSSASSSLGGSSGTQPAHKRGQMHNLTVCLADGTSYAMEVSPATAVLEDKQHIRSTKLPDPGAAPAEPPSASSGLPPAPLPTALFWQDEHAIQRQHIFVQGVEDELADSRSIDSLGYPPVLFLLADSEAAFMARQQEEAEALLVELQGLKVRDLVRCAGAEAEAEAEAEAGTKEAAGAEQVEVEA